MVILKNVKVETRANSSSELLVIGRFKKGNIKNSISFLSNEDKIRTLEAVSVDLSDGESGDYLIVSGSNSYKRIMIYNLGEKDKITDDIMRAFGSKLYSLVNSKKIKSML